MVRLFPTGKTPSEAGFTLMELLMVLFIVGLLASVSVPIVSSSLTRAREAALLETLAITRRSIDAYYSDKGSYPETLAVLVGEKYLRSIPVDPITKSESWHLEYTQDSTGIIDLHSNSTEQGSKNTSYSEW